MKFISVLKKLVVFVLVVLVILLISKNPTSRPQLKNHGIETSAEELKKHVQALSALRGRNLDKPNQLKGAAEYIQEEWKKQGWEVTRQTYKVSGQEVANITISYNKTTDPQQKTIIIGAHYDVFSDFPGADDNASGVSGLLELTRIVKKHHPKTRHRIDFVAYTLEEPPHYDTEAMGSLVHAKLMKETGRNISLMISLEMIGFFNDEPKSQNYPIPFLSPFYSDRGNFIAMIGEYKEWFLMRKLKTYFQQMTNLPLFSINMTKYLQGIDWSDHRSYWQMGYPAVMITDTSYLRNKNYHTENDLPETLDYSRMGQVVLGVFGIMTEY